MQAGWISDVHLNFLTEPQVQGYLKELVQCEVDAWLLTGDIGESRSVARFLRVLERTLPSKIYFVLGNHDFYGEKLDWVKAQVQELVSQSGCLVWLTAAGPQQLPDDVAIVGDDGWADARLGSPYLTPVELTDFFAIADLRELSRQELVSKLRTLGDESACRLAPKLEEAALTNERIFVLTHVPPFWKAAWHEGRLSDRDWVPWFTCTAVGKVLMAAAAAHPSVNFVVLCGHTHSQGECSPAHNLKVYTAGAKYGAPGLQGFINLAAVAESNGLDTLFDQM